jgi:hypothetical protein
LDFMSDVAINAAMVVVIAAMQGTGIQNASVK